MAVGRRNMPVAGLAAGTLLLLVAVAVVASVGYLRTARASALEKIQRKKAEETLALAVEVLDSIFRQFAPDRTAPVSASLRVSDADDPITVPVQPVLSKEAAALLEHMLKFYDRLADEGGDDGRLRRKVAEANRRVGDIRQRLGQYAESETAYVRAIELYVRLAEASPHDADLRSEIARIQNELGNVYDAMDRREAGRQSHREALAILEAAVAAPGPRPTAATNWRGPTIFSANGRGWPLGLLRRVLMARARSAANRPLSSSIRAVRVPIRWPPFLSCSTKRTRGD